MKAGLEGQPEEVMAGAMEVEAGWRKPSSREKSSYILPEESRDAVAFVLVRNHEGCSFHLPLLSPIERAHMLVCVCVSVSVSVCVCGNTDMWVNVLSFNHAAGRPDVLQCRHAQE